MSLSWTKQRASTSSCTSRATAGSARNATGGERRTKAIARRVAYHGASLGALALTGVESYKAPFSPPAIDVRHVSPTNRFRLDEDLRFGDAVNDDAAFSLALLEEIEAVVLEEGPETIALFIAEPVQNARGASSRRPATGRGCASSPTATASCWWPTR
jgi:adenosylmethionine-8-amino-7-oxononanoate aminotransferase